MIRSDVCRASSQASCPSSHPSSRQYPLVSGASFRTFLYLPADPEGLRADGFHCFPEPPFPKQYSIPSAVVTNSLPPAAIIAFGLPFISLRHAVDAERPCTR